MRLIDAYKFREMMDHEYPFDKYTQMHYPALDEAKSAVLKILDICPAVEVESVRHGYWVKSSEYKGDDTSGYIDNRWTCSECGEEAIVNEWFMYDLTDYCPHCGAKMDKVTE